MGKRINTSTGVYVIKDLSNNKVYYGSALDINTRLKEHSRELNLNIHKNQHMQNAYNKDGVENFIMKPFITVDTTDLDYETTNNFIRIIEQCCIDFFESCNKDKGFNKAESTVSGGSCFLTMEDLKSGDSKINDEQFIMIMNLLQNNRNSYRQIGEAVGVDSWYIKQIAQRKVLTNLTKGYFIPQRYNQTQSDKELYYDTVIHLKENGHSRSEIAEKLNLTYNRVSKIINYKKINNTGYSKKTYQFDLQGNFLKEYNSTRDAALANNLQAQYIQRACNHICEWGKSGDYLWSYQDCIPEMTLIERLLGEKITPTSPHLIICYQDNIPVYCFRGSKEAANFFNVTQSTINNLIKKQGQLYKGVYSFLYGEDAKEKDLLFLLNRI